jgi:4-diphosphocytidyl-2-C-methyl-D-erythritol kinase
LIDHEWRREWPAPAKLNLFLHVVGRCPDGYHLLQTVFRFIDYGDSLRFAPRDDGELVLATPIPGVPASSDLCLRAAQALKKAAGVADGATIHLTKRLPMGGGLGGGSSDAATTLMALNHLWETGFTSAELQKIGLALGADVPVFIHGRTSFAEGIGEQFSDVVSPPAWYLVVVPPVLVPTPEIFRSPSLRRDTPVIVPARWFAGFGVNDLEPVACEFYPVIAKTLAWLRQFGDARMSGSGACCFIGLDNEAEVQAILERLPSGLTGFAARGLDCHPLFDLT